MKAPFRWYGGKGKMLAKLLPLIPKTTGYCEPFCGAASVFFNKQRSPLEVLNDLDGNVVNLFRVLQDKTIYENFKHKIQHTPYARDEFNKARLALENAGSLTPIERAWCFFVAINQGFAGQYPDCAGAWGRSFIIRDNVAEAINRWLMRLTLIDEWHARLMQAYIDNVPAIQCIQYWDNPNILFYVDPPYVAETRAKTHVNVYDHEMNEQQHAELVQVLCSLQGQAVVSCYDHAIYQPLLSAGYRRIDIETVAHAAAKGRNTSIQGKGSAFDKVPRTETIYHRTVISDMCDTQLTLFDEK